ncbi:hypothetical protein C8R46DRAFT_1077852 [Mycena filopes]|nr:hypothetical protein C8R46DRAFT_1077852 [Mycena filopes]
MDSSSPPCFSPDLERGIVETAAYSYLETIPPLLLVSHRVHEWIERIRYRTVTVDGKLSTLSVESLLRAIRSNIKPPNFFADRVQHLFAGYTLFAGDDELAEVLSVCTGIQSLTIRSAPLTLLGALRPRRLSISLHGLLQDLRSPHLPPMFSLVTHLELLDALDDLAPGSILGELSRLPALTHLALYNCSANATDILTGCAMLELLVDEHYSKGERELRHPYTIDDMRFVSILLSNAEYTGDWVLGAQGGRDFWVRGDMFVAKKRRGEIEPSSRYWIEDGDGI